MVFGRVWADLSGALRLRWSFLAAPLRCAAACGARNASLFTTFHGPKGPFFHREPYRRPEGLLHPRFVRRFGVYGGISIIFP